jgi:hypothetical protein
MRGPSLWSAYSDSTSCTSFCETEQNWLWQSKCFQGQIDICTAAENTSPPLYERQLSRSSMGQQHDEAEPEDFSLSIRDPALRQQRKQAAKAVVMASILMNVAVWACLSIFWGSTCA